MNKVLDVFLLIFISVFLISQIAYGTDSLNIIEQQSLDKFEESKKVKEVVEDDQLNIKKTIFDLKDELGREEFSDIKNIDEIVFGEPYKVIVADYAVIKDLINNKPILESIENSPYSWEVPIFRTREVLEPIGSFEVDIVDGKWGLAEVGGYMFPEDIAFSSSPEEISKFLEENQIENINSFFRICISELGTDFLYVNTDDNEYFIPLIYNVESSYGYKNRQILARDELVEKIEEPIKRLGENKDLDIGSSPDTTSPNKINKYAIVLISSLSIFLIILLSNRKFKKA